MLARALIDKRGKLEQAEIDAFLGAGFDPGHLLEVIAASAASTITNYTASVTKPTLKERFHEHAWRAT